MAKLTKRPVVLTYMEIPYNVTQYFYKCETCKEEFTEIETDTKTLSQVEPFRLKHLNK